MSELTPIWDNTDLTGATLPLPYKIPNNPNAKTIKLNNQSRYWLIISQTNSGKQLDRIEPFSFIIFPYEPDLTLSIDTINIVQESTLTPDKEFIDYTTFGVTVGYQKGSTLFSGATPSIITAMTSKQINIMQQGSNGASLSSGQYETYYFYSPINTMSTAIALYVDWPGFSGGSATNHRYMSFNIKNKDAPQIPYMYASAVDTTKEFSFSFNNFLQAKGVSSNVTVLPSTDAAALATIVRGITFDENNAFEVQFYTDDSNDNTARTIILYVIQETIA